MIITVSDELLAFIEDIETEERRTHPNAYFTWLYSEYGSGAIGTASVQYIYREWDISADEGIRTGYVRDIGKYDYDNLEDMFPEEDED